MPNERISSNFGQVAAQFSYSTPLTQKLLNRFSLFFSHNLEQFVELLTRASTRRLVHPNLKNIREINVLTIITMTTYAERLTKIGLVVTEIFGRICQFLQSRPTSCSCYPRNLWAYWTECHQNCTQCTEIHAIYYFEVRIVIFQSVSEWQCHKGDSPIFRL